MVRLVLYYAKCSTRRPPRLPSPEASPPAPQVPPGSQSGHCLPVAQWTSSSGRIKSCSQVGAGNFAPIKVNAKLLELLLLMLLKNLLNWMEMPMEWQHEPCSRNTFLHFPVRSLNHLEGCGPWSSLIKVIKSQTPSDPALIQKLRPCETCFHSTFPTQPWPASPSGPLHSALSVCRN